MSDGVGTEDGGSNTGGALDWAEAGFLVSLDRGIYVHCSVLEKDARFTTSEHLALRQMCLRHWGARGMWWRV